MKHDTTSLFGNKRNYLVPFTLVTMLFFFWGLANNMTDTLLAAFKNILNMSDYQTSFIQMAFYGSYACFALPAAFLIRHYNFKSGIIVGLLLYTLGAFLFYPAALTSSYGFYLFAIYILAGGCSILETTANPYILTMGPKETATRRLNYAQSFNPIGSITGIILSHCFILSILSADKQVMNTQQLIAAQQSELFAITKTYMFVGIVLLILLIAIYLNKNMPNGNESNTVSFKKTVAKLIKRKHYTWGVIAQFFYVGAQICVWSFTIRYVMIQLNLVDPITNSIIANNISTFIEQYPTWSNLWKLSHESTAENIGNTFYLTSLILFTTSRFIFTALMKYFSAGTLLASAALGAAFSTIATIMYSGIEGVIGLVAISFFMSLMFPTIYGIALEDMNEDESKVGGSFLVMAILGGAVLTATQGYISTLTNNIQISYAIPFICFIIVGLYGLHAYKSVSQQHKTKTSH